MTHSHFSQQENLMLKKKSNYVRPEVIKYITPEISKLDKHCIQMKNGMGNDGGGVMNMSGGTGS